MTDSKQTRAQLIAENQAMRHRLETLEKRPGKERRNNYLLRIFIDSIPNFGLSFNSDGQILQVITGSQHSESKVLEGRHIDDILPVDDIGAIKSALHQTIKTEQTQSFEFVFSMMAGRRWYRVRTFFANENNNRSVLVVFLFQDTTNEKLANGVLKLAQLELEQQSNPSASSDHSYRHLIDNSLQGIYIHHSHQFLYVNQKFAEMFGYASAKEVLEAGNVLDFYPSSEHERLWNYHDSRISGGSAPAQYEIQGLRIDGSLLWLEILVQRVNWKGQQSILGTVVDISDRKRAEDRLGKSEISLAQAQIVAHLGSLEWDIQANKQHWSDETYRIIGYEPQSFEPSEKRFSDILHPGDRKRVLSSMNDAVWDGAPFDMVCRIIRPDGIVRFVHAQGEVTRDRLDNPLRMIGTVQDITNRKRAENKLIESEAQYRDILDGSLQGVLILDSEQVLYANSMFAQIHGYDEISELIGIDRHLDTWRNSEWRKHQSPLFGVFGFKLVSDCSRRGRSHRDRELFPNSCGRP